MRHTHGSIEVICGSMFSGKTDELISAADTRKNRQTESAGLQACH